MSEPELSSAGSKIRIDKWLWYARVVKTRTRAQALVKRGKIRINTIKTSTPGQIIRPGDVLTITLERQIRVLKVVFCGVRRGPAVEAQGLYEDLSPAPVPKAVNTLTDEAHAARGEGAGRPTKKQRRELSAFRSRAGEEF